MCEFRKTTYSAYGHGCLKNRYLFPTILEAEVQGKGVSRVGGLLRALLWLADGHIITASSQVKLWSLPLLLGTLIPSLGPHPHQHYLNLITPKGSTSKDIALGVRASTCTFWRNTHSVCDTNRKR